MLRQLRRERRGKGKFPLFVHFYERVLKHLGLPKATRTQRDICNYLQFGPTRSIIEAFRGVGKSYITSAFVDWSLDNDPQTKIMVVSANAQRAKDFSQFCKRLINEMPELAHLRPGKQTRWANEAWDVGPAITDHSPSVKSVGITGQLTGSRADIIVADDVEVPKNSMTALMRERNGELVKEFDNVLKPLPTSRIIYLGTPQTEMSLYNVLFKERGYSVRIWPARIPVKHEVYKGNLAPFVMDMINGGQKAGTPVDPERFTHKTLLERELSLGTSTFRLQFMMDTSGADGSKYPLKLQDLIVMALDPENGPGDLAWAKDPRTSLDSLESVGFSGDTYYGPAWVGDKFYPWQGAVLAIDPSGRGTDETAYAIVRMLHGRLFLVACGGLKGGYSEENMTKLAQLAKRYAVNSVLIESNFGDGMFGALLKPYLTKIWPVSVEEVRASGQKEVRIIQTLEPVMQQHRLVVDRAVIEAELAEADDGEGDVYSLFYQMTRVNRDRGCLQHDDRLDVLEMAVAYWLRHMEVDAAEAAFRAAEDALDAEIEAMLADGPISVKGLSEVFLDPERPGGRSKNMFDG